MPLISNASSALGSNSGVITAVRVTAYTKRVVSSITTPVDDTATIANADAATAAEGTTLTATLSFADSCVTVENASLTVSVSSADTATDSEAQTLALAFSNTESASASESTSIQVANTSSDARPATVEGNSVAATVPTSADSRTATESNALSVDLTSADTVTRAEVSGLAAALSSLDTSAAVEAQTVDQGATPKQSTETAGTSEAFSLVVTITSSDVRAALDAFANLLAGITSTDVNIVIESQTRAGGPPSQEKKFANELTINVSQTLGAGTTTANTVRNEPVVGYKQKQDGAPTKVTKRVEG